MCSHWSLVSLFSLPRVFFFFTVTSVTSDTTITSFICVSFFPSLSWFVAHLSKLKHRCVQWVIRLQRDPIFMDFPPGCRSRKRKASVFFQLAGDHEHSVFFFFQMKRLQQKKNCVYSHIYPLTPQQITAFN